MSAMYLVDCCQTLSHLVQLGEGNLSLEEGTTKVELRPWCVSIHQQYQVVLGGLTAYFD